MHRSSIINLPPLPNASDMDRQMEDAPNKGNSVCSSKGSEQKMDDSAFKPAAAEEDQPDMPAIGDPDRSSISASAPAAAAASPSSAPKGSDDKQTFLYAFYDILNTPDKLTPSSIKYEDVVTWLPHGKGFIISDKSKFEKEILPTFLPHTKYASFTRRLKRWKFVRVSSGVELGAYYHPQFQRGKPYLIKLISTDAQLQHDSNYQPSMPSAASMGMSPQMAHHQALFSDIRLPYSEFGSSGGEAVGSYAAARSARQAAAGATVPSTDVRDFPTIMRQISKAKRKELILSKRTRESGSGAMSGGAMGGFTPPYTSDPRMGMMPQMPGGGFYPSSQYPSSYPSMYGDPYSSMMMQGNPYSSMMMQGNPYSSMMMQGSAGMSSSGMTRRPTSPPSEEQLHASSHESTAAGQTAFDRIYRQHRQAAAMMYGDTPGANDPSLSSIAQDWLTMKQQQRQQQGRQEEDSSADRMGKAAHWEETAKDSDEEEED